jgi:hypothetical protein
LLSLPLNITLYLHINYFKKIIIFIF